MLSFLSTNTPPRSLLSGLLSIHPLPSISAWIALTRIQDLALGVIELQKDYTSPSEASPGPSGWHSFPPECQSTTQLGVNGKPAEGALDPTVHVTDTDVKQCQSQYQALMNDTHHWSPRGTLSH